MDQKWQKQKKLKNGGIVVFKRFDMLKVSNMWC